jgi:orotidine-5'-phosphate decarboxylase
MLEAAKEGLEDGAAGNLAGVLAITVLTSMDEATFAMAGFRGSMGEQVARMTRMGDEAGCEGVVCGVKQLGVVAQVAPHLAKVTPGIRNNGSADDQHQSGSAIEAAAKGADIIVVGRPITRSPDPISAARELMASVAN